VSLRVPQAISALFGIGLGLANTALLIAVQTSVAWRQRGVATASTMFARTIGGTLAVGVLGAALTASLLRDSSIPEGAADRRPGARRGPGRPGDPVARRLAADRTRHGLLGDRGHRGRLGFDHALLPRAADPDRDAGPGRGRTTRGDERAAARGLTGRLAEAAQ